MSKQILAYRECQACQVFIQNSVDQTYFIARMLPPDLLELECAWQHFD